MFSFIGTQMIQSEEKAELTKVFKALDITQTGTLSKEELKAAYLEFFDIAITDDELDDADDTGDTQSAVIGMMVSRVSRSSLGGGIDITDGAMDAMDNPLVLGRGNSASALTESLSSYHYSRVRQSFGFLMDGKSKPVCPAV